MLYTSKESSEHVKCRFRLKKYDLLLKKWKKLILKKKFQRGDPLKSERLKKKIPFFKFSKYFFEKWLQWDVANIDRNKVMKFELISSIHREITRDNQPGGVFLTPPHVE